MDKLLSISGISFVEIAETANIHGYPRLAVKVQITQYYNSQLLLYWCNDMFKYICDL